MQPYRLFVEKKEPFRVEAESLREDLNSNLGLNISQLRLISVYDLFGFTPQLKDKTSYRVFGEPATDIVTETIDLDNVPHLAVEALPGQFDQRAAAAEECVKLLQPDADINIRSGNLIIFDKDTSKEDIDKIASYVINAVESRKKDMSKLEAPGYAVAKPVEILQGFTEITKPDAATYCKEKGLAMNADDLMEVVNYFKSEGRDPFETELRILDTYWSDHCRHTTFTTVLTDIKVDDSFISADLEESIAEWKKIRQILHRENKPLCLMDLATIGARYLKKEGYLEDLEQSEENNACSIFVDIDVDGKTERWLLQFKNETHNHPTEIEPFGGASTCLGGAIRDPLSGRSYVYQAMRVTGAADIYKPVAETIKGKLPQRVISVKAAEGYSSYGNQIGLATTHVRELYHPGYLAKRLEVGAVVGAVKADQVRRESPAPGDVVLMFGGRTGRDGIGGATGSSKEHTTSSLEECGSEVQKGNAPEERKIERLFKRPEVTKLIKKSNDFGAGGVSVAIGELTDGLDIYLDRVPVKYSGLNPTEIAISESQERMSVVVDPKDKDKFMDYCREENLEVTHVADVTDTGRMRMFYQGKLYADLRRDFIDSAGAPHFAEAEIGPVEAVNPFEREIKGSDIKEKFLNLLADDNVTSQKGLIERFDSSIGKSTVLMPFGGKTQRTEVQVSVQKFPVAPKHTDSASMMAFGFNPFITEWSPYHGASYAFIEAVGKAVAAGADYTKMRFSFQEYFERLHSPLSWGKPLAALLGALRMQLEFKLPSIGGKDSMSGTFANISVPPTLIAFGIAPVKASEVISPELKASGNLLYLVRHNPLPSLMPDSEQLMDNFKTIHRLIKEKTIVAAYYTTFGGIAEALAKMSFGNRVGVNVTVKEADLFDYGYGNVIVESNEVLFLPNFELLGETISEDILEINGTKIGIEEAFQANRKKFTEIYPDKTDICGNIVNADGHKHVAEYPGEAKQNPVVYLPVFPGTNCDYDMAASFRKEGAEIITSIFRNHTPEDIDESIKEIADNIDKADILAFSGGFSEGDEPDGSGKFIANVIMNDTVKDAINRLLERKGLVLGICNGFQALVKSGLLPYGKIGELDGDSPTLFHNDINRHISQIVSTRVASSQSPWLAGFEEGELHSVAASHGEGKFVANKELLDNLRRNGQIAFQYVDEEGNATMQSPYNPNGSYEAIEGIISPDGLILGKMAHSERYDEGLMKNIHGNKSQNLFANAVAYFRKNNKKDNNQL
ncbi:MAG: phosphoribosylformylglycinamidine synthase [Muribaculaceae bacterium]|nr:phosphoribosylformylglycinamidine synthase [Muribaculaceae bacterium]